MFSLALPIRANLLFETGRRVERWRQLPCLPWAGEGFHAFERRCGKGGEICLRFQRRNHARWRAACGNAPICGDAPPWKSKAHQEMISNETLGSFFAILSSDIGLFWLPFSRYFICHWAVCYFMYVAQIYKHAHGFILPTHIHFIAEQWFWIRKTKKKPQNDGFFSLFWRGLCHFRSICATSSLQIILSVELSIIIL